jgi:hypothetical protein
MPCIKAFDEKPSEKIFFDLYLENKIHQLIQEGKRSSAETYDAVLKRIRLCFGGQGVRFSDINRDWVFAFRDYLRQNNLSANTINTYLSIARNIHNGACATFGLGHEPSPFYQIVRPTSQRSRDTPDINLLTRITNSKLIGQEYLMFSRDLFLFSHYAGGMSFRDMALLKKKDIQNEFLSFKKSRSGGICKAKLTSEMKTIIQKYKTDGIYLFPVILKSDKEPYQQYRSGLRKYNIHLKKLADFLNINVPLYTPMKFKDQHYPKPSFSYPHSPFLSI